MTDKPYHHGDLKAALVTAARQLLKDKGADALSLRAIAAEVGVSHMAPYTHFKNKKDLMQAVAASGFDELTERLLRVRERYSKPWELVLNYGVEYVQFAIDNPEVYRLMLSQVDMGGRRNRPEVKPAKIIVSPRLESSTQRPFELLQAAFAREGVDPTLVTARAATAWSMVHGMSALIIDGHLQIPEGLTAKELFIMAVSPAMMKI